MNLQPVIFGEVLFDIFPDGQKVLGGAPFNVANYLRGFGVNPCLISSVGDDNNGSEIIESMNSNGLDVNNVNILSDHPTGHALIHMKDGDQTFELPEDVAYDYINADENLVREIISGKPPLLYHGSLALRSKTSRDTLQKLRNYLDIPVFVDINLRDPWYSKEIIYDCLQQCRWLKLNHEELNEIMKDNTKANSRNIEDLASELLYKHKIDILVVTLGSAGVVVIEAGRDPFRLSQKIPGTIVDTVGAGDAFSAVTILGIINQWDIKTTIKRAVQFASEICQVKGAIPVDITIYKTLLNRWEPENG